MKFIHSHLLSCPLDQLPLREGNSCLQCENGHNFDIARHGYVNLLGATDKRSRDPGDSREMVLARREFLNNGHYQPVAQKLAELIEPLVSADSTIVDAGCGEGYYLEQLHTLITGHDKSAPTMIGYDISKWAVQAATRRLTATWLVASNRNIPLARHSVDCLLTLFGFPMFESFHTVLKKGGTVVSVDAGPQHLIELREIIYPEVRHSESSVLQQAVAAGFSAGETSTATYRTAPLSQIEIHQLLKMTPHLFRASHEGKERAARLDHFPVTVDVVFQLLHNSEDHLS
jgi:23S rRNA (guanine745-N1)-methyltransferase